MEYIIYGEEYVHQKLLKEKEKIELSKWTLSLLSLEKHIKKELISPEKG